MQYKSRCLESRIRRLLRLFPAVAVIGPRQCGKSTLVRALFPDWHLYDLERPDDYQLITSDPLGFFRRRGERIVIDEVQQFPELFKILRVVIDEDRSAAGRFILTGSSSPAIVRGLSESLAGRMATVELWPFKAAEYAGVGFPAIYDLIVDLNIEALLDCPPAVDQDVLWEQWLRGGYPEPRIKSGEDPAFFGMWMDAYFHDYVSRDIRNLFPRIKAHSFRMLVQSLAFQSGRVLNKSAIARALEVSSVTVGEYMEILHETFVWRNLRSFEKNSLKRVQKAPRGFFRDSGFLHHLLKLGSIDELLVHPGGGGSFESFMIEEIIRGLQCTMESGLDFYYYRTRDGSEIDMIIEGVFGLLPVEIKLGHRVKRESLRALNRFLDDTGAPFGILVNTSDRIEMLTDRIIKIPAIFW